MTSSNGNIFCVTGHLCGEFTGPRWIHYDDVIMRAVVSQITSLTIVYSTVYSGADQRKHQSSASLAFVPGIHRGPVNSPHKGPLTRKMFPFDDVIMFPAQRPVTRSFNVFFDLRLNKRLSKQSWGWWFQTLSGPLWPHCNEMREKHTTDTQTCIWFNINQTKCDKRPTFLIYI